MAADSDWVWVLEGFRATGELLTWDLTDLEDDIVREHFGWLPEALMPVPESLLAYLRNRYGIDVNSDDFDDLIIGRWSRRNL